MKRTKKQPLTTTESLLKKMGEMFPDDTDDPKGTEFVRAFLADCAPQLEECEKRRQEALDQICNGIKERQAEVRERVKSDRSHYLKSGKKIV